MVTSEQVLEFIKTRSEVNTVRDQDGEIEFRNVSLDGSDLASALEQLTKIIGIEAAMESEARSLEAHMGMHEVAALQGNGGGHDNYN